MKKISSITLEELIQLDEEYSQKNNRQNGDLRNRISNHEKIIFCYFELIDMKGTTVFQTRPELLFYILTDIKVSMSYQTEVAKGLVIVPTIAFLDITLDKIKEVAVVPTSTFLNPSGVVIKGSSFYSVNGYAVGSMCLFKGAKDSEFLQSIGGAIRQAKTNLDYQLRSSTTSKQNLTTQNSTVEQLEKLADLYKSGVITDDEYKRAKERVLSKD